MIKQAKHQKGFILLLVIALIPLLGMASIVLTSNSRQILTNTRRAALKTHARLACESGIAWINENRRNLPTKNQPQVLGIENTGKQVYCTIELISQTDEQSEFKITGQAEDKRFSCKHSEQFLIKH